MYISHFKKIIKCYTIFISIYLFLQFIHNYSVKTEIFVHLWFMSMLMPKNYTSCTHIGAFTIKMDGTYSLSLTPLHHYLF